MKNITAVFLKQLGDTLKNKTILLQFVLFPVIAVVMENSITLENMPEHFFVKCDENFLKTHCFRAEFR